jgi:hypothetical protein
MWQFLPNKQWEIIKLFYVLIDCTVLRLYKIYCPYLFIHLNVNTMRRRRRKRYGRKDNAYLNVRKIKLLVIMLGNRVYIVFLMLQLLLLMSILLLLYTRTYVYRVSQMLCILSMYCMCLLILLRYNISKGDNILFL